MFRTFLFGAVFFFLSYSAQAVSIFDNGGPDGSRGYWSDLSQGQEMADDFTLLAGSNTIGGVSWSGSYFSNNVPVAVDDFTVRIFSSLASTTPLHSFNVGNAVGRSDSGIDDSTFGLDIYNYSAMLPSLTLTAGTQYWLSVVNDTAGSATDWLWENSATSGGNAYRTAAAGTWSTGTSELAFNLSGASSTVVPLPAAFPLFASGLGLLGLMSWRRKRKAA
ncbi:MAG: VPLPA-CTERM sorting domain-containing protein [Rhizobiaceae bacterium]